MASSGARESAPPEPRDELVRGALEPGRSRLETGRVAADQTRLAGRLAQGALFGAAGLLFPDSCGKITHMALQFGNVEFDRPLPEETRSAVLGMYGQLMRHMAPDTRFTVVCADSRNAESIRELVDKVGKDPSRVNIVPAETVDGFSIWIRDSMLPVRMPDGRTLLMIQDRTYWPGPEDASVPPLIRAANASLESAAHPALRIDGGNVVSNQRHVFVGQDSVDHTRALLRELAEDPERLKDIGDFYRAWTGQEDLSRMWDELPELVFEKAFGRPVLVLGADDPSTPVREEQPAFHIDMCVTPIGERKMLVGDPGMAIDALRQLSLEERTRVNAEMAAQAGIEGNPDLIGQLIEVNGTPEAQANYDAVANQLRQKGYDVERIPSMIGLRKTWSLPYLTYNNCMQEVYGDVRKVYLPTYGCAPLDRMASETYRANGFEVVPLEMAAISKLEGAVRCSTYAVERDLGVFP